MEKTAKKKNEDPYNKKEKTLQVPAAQHEEKEPDKDRQKKKKKSRVHRTKSPEKKKKEKKAKKVEKKKSQKCRVGKVDEKGLKVREAGRIYVGY